MVEPQSIYKIILFGETGAGKSSLFTRYILNTYPEEGSSTIGIEFSTKEITTDSGTTKLQIWDTAGQEQYRALSSAYYRGASAGLLVYNSTNRDALKEILKYAQEFRNHSPASSKLYVVASSVESDSRVITYEQGLELANSLGAGLFEVSAKTGQGIHEMFAAIANDLNSKPTEKLTDDAEVLKSNEEQNLETENKAKQTEHKELRLKLLIVGDSGVGKTSLLRMFSDNIYNADYFPTIGIDFMFKRIEIEEVQIKLQIWDSSGHERFRAIISNYYKSSDGIILIYNSNNCHAFENLNKWHEEIKQHAPGTVKLTVVGNQFENENKIVQYDQGKSFADSIGADFIEVDIKKNENVELAFTKLAKSILVQKDPEVAQKTSELDKKTPNPTQARGLGDELINIIILGDPKVGKSTLILKYTDDQFMPNYISTIGVDFRTKTLTDGSQTVKAQIWDLSGQRRFSGITSMYYKGAQGIILMYNSNDLESFNNLDYWVQSIRTNGKSNVPILVVGNQFDPETPQVTYQQALNFSQRISAKFIQIDVKSGFNVEEAFLSIISSIKSNR